MRRLFYPAIALRCHRSRHDAGSSAIGAYMELGPCSVVEGEGKNNLTTMPNPSSWNSRASVFFLDEPINVGFSYSKNGQTVGTTEAAALDVQAFISIFFETFSEFKGRKLHLAGESYGGRVSQPLPRSISAYLLLLIFLCV